MMYEEYKDMETDEEVSNRIKDTENDLWACDDSVRDAIAENLSKDVLSLLRAARKCEKGRGSELSVFHKLGQQLFEDTEAYISAQAVELETGLLPGDKK